MPSLVQDKSIASALTAAGDWVKTRINNIDIFDEHHQLEAKTNPFYALGPIFYLVWFIVMATGLILIMWYVPTKSAAFDSILNIQNGIPIGGLMRGMHKYGADAMIIAATMRLYRMFINADYKPSKEFNIAIALVTLLLSMYSGLSGYLLIWNQRAFWATKVFLHSARNAEDRNSFQFHFYHYPTRGLRLACIKKWPPLTKIRCAELHD